MKISIKIVLMGHLRHHLNLKSLQSVKSKYFKIETVEHIDNLPEPKNNDGYLSIVYAKDEISNFLKKTECSGICVGIMNYRFEDNFYMHRVGNNKMCISIAEIDHLLLENEISIENFIIKCIYEAVVFYKIFGNIVDDRVYGFVHRDTRGCLFDLNGDTNDILYNTEKPNICDECCGKINHYSLPSDFLKTIKKELKNIKKPKIKAIEIFIRKYPLFSVLITFVISVVINIISSYLWECIKYLTAK